VQRSKRFTDAYISMHALGRPGSGTHWRLQRLLAGLLKAATTPQGEVEMKSYAISDDMKRGPASALMDLMAERMVEFAAECGESMTQDGGEEPTLGFCFSFPVNQTALDHGTLIRWTKGAYCTRSCAELLFLGTPPAADLSYKPVSCDFTPLAMQRGQHGRCIINPLTFANGRYLAQGSS